MSNYSTAIENSITNYLFVSPYSYILGNDDERAKDVIAIKTDIAIYNKFLDNFIALYYASKASRCDEDFKRYVSDFVNTNRNTAGGLTVKMAALKSKLLGVR